MNIVKFTNKIALISVLGLMYWVFIFICSMTFGFKVFQENITEMFMLSILGIFAVLLGAIILNIMYNLTAIAEGRGDREKSSKKSRFHPFLLFSGSLVVIFTMLYVGDKATTQREESNLISAASALVKEQKQIIAELSDYSFSKEYLLNTSQQIKILSQVDEKFPSITVIMMDKIQGNDYLFGWNGYIYIEENKEPQIVDYILSTSNEERKYLFSVFNDGNMAHKFSANDGNYEIYYPVKTQNGVIVLHLSQYRRYGKLGS